MTSNSLCEPESEDGGQAYGRVGGWRALPFDFAEDWQADGNIDGDRRILDEQVAMSVTIANVRFLSCSSARLPTATTAVHTDHVTLTSTSDRYVIAALEPSEGWDCGFLPGYRSKWFLGHRRQRTERPCCPE